MYKLNNQLVSVIMSTYKETDQQLIASIESILNQTYQDLEFIIILDNPGNEYISKIIESYCKLDHRIIFIRNKTNIGLTDSLNKALKIAKGTYIARMDADDIAYLERIEKQVKYMNEHDTDILGTDIGWIDEDGQVIYDKMGVPAGTRRLNKLLKISNCVAHPTWMVKKEVYQELQGYRDIPMSEDYDFLLRGLKRGYKIDNIGEVLLNYRMTQGSISRGNALKQFLVSRYLQNHIETLELITKEDILKEIEKQCSSEKETRFSDSSYKMNVALTQIYHKRYMNALVNLIQSFLNSSDFRKKVLRLVWCRFS